MPDRTFHEVPLDGGDPNLMVMQEKRHYAPTDAYARGFILARVPFGKRAKVVYLTRLASDARTELKYIRTGLVENMNDPNLNASCDDRLFTAGKDRDQMAKIMQINAPQSFDIIGFWEPIPAGADPGQSIITFVTQAVLKDAASAAKSKTDGLDTKTIAELKTLIGLAGIKGADGKPLITDPVVINPDGSKSVQSMTRAALVQTLRDHYKIKETKAKPEGKTEPKKEGVSVAG